MNKEEALAKIDEIHSVLMGSNSYAFPKRQFVIIGILLCLTPLFTIALDYLWIRLGLESTPASVQSLSYAVIFSIVFSLASRWGTDQDRESRRKQVHPLLQKNFGFEWVSAALILAAGVSLGFNGYEELIFPIILIIVGYYYLVLTAGSLPLLRIGSYGMIMSGLLGILFVGSIDLGVMTNVLLVWFGLMFITMGSAASKKESILHGA